MTPDITPTDAALANEARFVVAVDDALASVRGESS